MRKFKDFKRSYRIKSKITELRNGDTDYEFYVARCIVYKNFLGISVVKEKIIAEIPLNVWIRSKTLGDGISLKSGKFIGWC